MTISGDTLRDFETHDLFCLSPDRPHTVTGRAGPVEPTTRALPPGAFR